MKQKVILSFWILFVVSGFFTCTIDKSPVTSKEEEPCWNQKTTIRDYDYIKNRYFFVDDYYMNYFENGWTDDLSNFEFYPDRTLHWVEVFKSTTYTDPNAIKGIAVLNPQDNNYDGLSPDVYDTMSIIPGELEKGHFVELREYEDYIYREDMGFFCLNTEISDNEILAISYKTHLGQVGTSIVEMIDTSFASLPVLRLIKSKNMNPTHTNVWPLMMKNAYSLGQIRIISECFNIQIEHNLNGEHQKIQQVNPKESYLYLLGLDRTNNDGQIVDGGDGIVDQNFSRINFADGILIFPGIHPFNPPDTSRFQIAEKADLYETTNYTDMQSNHRYDIIVTHKVDE